eukprot:688403_1
MASDSLQTIYITNKFMKIDIDDQKANGVHMITVPTRTYHMLHSTIVTQESVLVPIFGTNKMSIYRLNQIREITKHERYSPDTLHVYIRNIHGACKPLTFKHEMTGLDLGNVLFFVLKGTMYRMESPYQGEAIAEAIASVPFLYHRNNIIKYDESSDRIIFLTDKSVFVYGNATLTTKLWIQSLAVGDDVVLKSNGEEATIMSAVRCKNSTNIDVTLTLEMKIKNFKSIGCLNGTFTLHGQENELSSLIQSTNQKLQLIGHLPIKSHSFFFVDVKSLLGFDLILYASTCSWYSNIFKVSNYLKWCPRLQEQHTCLNLHASSTKNNIARGFLYENKESIEIINQCGQKCTFNQRAIRALKHADQNDSGVQWMNCLAIGFCKSFEEAANLNIPALIKKVVCNYLG